VMREKNEGKEKKKRGLRGMREKKEREVKKKKEGEATQKNKRQMIPVYTYFLTGVLASRKVDANNFLSASTLVVDADSHILLFFLFFNKSIVINICMLYINWVIYIVINIYIYIFEGVKGYIYNFFKKNYSNLAYIILLKLRPIEKEK
jgi:hypothetical protein